MSVCLSVGIVVVVVAIIIVVVVIVVPATAAAGHWYLYCSIIDFIILFEVSVLLIPTLIPVQSDTNITSPWSIPTLVSHCNHIIRNNPWQSVTIHYHVQVYGWSNQSDHVNHRQPFGGSEPSISRFSVYQSIIEPTPSICHITNIISLIFHHLVVIQRWSQ